MSLHIFASARDRQEETHVNKFAFFVQLQFSPIFTNFAPFSSISANSFKEQTIFTNFLKESISFHHLSSLFTTSRQFSTNFCQFLAIFINFSQFLAISTNFSKFQPISFRCSVQRKHSIARFFHSAIQRYSSALFQCYFPSKPPASTFPVLKKHERKTTHARMLDTRFKSFSSP